MNESHSLQSAVTHRVQTTGRFLKTGDHSLGEPQSEQWCKDGPMGWLEEPWDVGRENVALERLK